MWEFNIIFVTHDTLPIFYVNMNYCEGKEERFMPRPNKNVIANITSEG